MPDLHELIDQGLTAERSGDLDRARQCYEQAIDASPQDAAHVDGVLEALTRLAAVLRNCSEWEQGLEVARRGQALAARAGLRPRLVESLIAEANILNCRGDFGEAVVLYRRALGMTADARTRGIALQNIGTILATRGELAMAENAFADSSRHFREAGYSRGEAIALNNFGRLALDRGDANRAEPILEQALAAARSVQDAELVALACLNLAEAALVRADMNAALYLASVAMGHFISSGNRWRRVECLRLLGAINEKRGDTDDAQRCYERALGVATEIGAAVDVQRLTEALSRLSNANVRASSPS